MEKTAAETAVKQVSKSCDNFPIKMLFKYKSNQNLKSVFGA